MDEPRETSQLLPSDGNEALYDATTSSNTGPPVEGSEGELKSYIFHIVPLAIGILLAALDGTIVVSSYASIGSDLNELQNTSWIVTAYLLTQTSFQPLLGKLSDIFGRKSCLLACYAFFGFGCLFCGVAATMSQLIAARALAGVGGSGMTSLVTIIISDLVPLRVRGTCQAIITVIFTLGSTIGIPLGGFLADNIGWRWAFLLQVPICLAAFASVSFTLHLPETNKASFVEGIKRIDFGGAATLVLSVFLLLFGLDRGGNISWSDPFTITSLTLSIVSTALHLYIENFIAREPFVPQRVLFNRSLLAGYLANFFGVASAWAQAFYASLFFQAVQGKSASEGSAWLLSCIFGNLIGSMAGGLIVQRTGKYYAITVFSYVLLFIGTVVVYLFGGVIVASTVGIATGLFLTNVGNGIGITTTLVSVIANAGQADQALATAVMYLFRSLGYVFGVSIGSSIIQATLRFWLNIRLSGHDVEEIIRRVRESLDYMKRLDPVTRATVTRSYGDAIQVTFLFTVIFAALSVVSSVFITEKRLHPP